MAASERIDASLVRQKVLSKTELDIAVLDRFVAELRLLQDKRSKTPSVQHPITPLLRLLRKELAAELSRVSAWNQWLDEACKREHERNSEHAVALQQAHEDLAPMQTSFARQMDVNDFVLEKEAKRFVDRRNVPEPSHVFWALRELLFDESPSLDIDAKFGSTMVSSSLTALAELRTAVESKLSAETQDSLLTRTWHAADATPPSDYPAGSLTGTKKQLVKWIMQKTDHRLLNTPLKEGTYWGRQDGKEQCSIWFKTQERYSEANARRLADPS